MYMYMHIYIYIYIYIYTHTHVTTSVYKGLVFQNLLFHDFEIYV